ncbi:uncharacterized protein LOC143125336 [Alosa pseudoharengus]|uniref:uncharacterized protein LOC143125336 n=1 Tax=Alosa pseudoharengus TaxID=34774 RepID=UPI003F8913A1
MEKISTGRQSPLCVVLTAAVGGYAITATTAQAIEAGDWFIKSTTLPEVIHMAEDTGAFGVGLLMTCLALDIALWSAAVGIKFATGVNSLLKMLGLNTSTMISVGPLMALGASGSGALLGTAAASLLVWGKQGLFIGLSVVLLVSCIVMWPFVPALRNPPEECVLLMKQLIVFLIIQFIVIFLGIILSFVHPGAYILMLIMTWATVGSEPTRQCTLAQKLLRHVPGQMPDSGDFFVYSFCMVTLFTGFTTGTTAFFLSYRQKAQQYTKIILLSCAHIGPLCATIMGSVIGIYSMLGLKTKDAETVALGAVSTTILALKGVPAALDSLGPCGTAGMLLGVGSIAGLSVEAAVIAAKMRYRGPGGAGALLGAFGGAILGTISLSVSRKILLLFVTTIVAAIPNLERIERIGCGEVKTLESAVEGAVFFGIVALATGAVGLAVIVIGFTGNTGFVISIVVSLVAIIYLFKFTK